MDQGRRSLRSCSKTLPSPPTPSPPPPHITSETVSHWPQEVSLDGTRNSKHRNEYILPYIISYITHYICIIYIIIYYKNILSYVIWLNRHCNPARDHHYPPSPEGVTDTQKEVSHMPKVTKQAARTGRKVKPARF